MAQNRKKLIVLLIGNLSNSIVHKILENAIKGEKRELADKYRRELMTSFQIAKRYREKINPINGPLSKKDILYIKDKTIKRVKSELQTRISKGYENITLSLVENEVDKALKDLHIL